MSFSSTTTQVGQLTQPVRQVAGQDPALVEQQGGEMGQIGQFRRQGTGERVAMWIQPFECAQVAQRGWQRAIQAVLIQHHLGDAPVAVSSHPVPRGRRLCARPVGAGCPVRAARRLELSSKTSPRCAGCDYAGSQGLRRQCNSGPLPAVVSNGFLTRLRGGVPSSPSSRRQSIGAIDVSTPSPATGRSLSA